MAKIAQIAAKYIVYADISIEGVVDKPDVIGAIFGQTEGLLGADLELRELQRSGRIGRIDVNVDTKSGKTNGEIIIPSSLDKSETAIVGAALEVIQRIGPCNAKIKVKTIEDVRISKRAFVVERAKELLRNLMDSVMPDSQEIADEVAYSVRQMEITEYGRERLPAGPNLDEADELIVVEGRADVLNMLKYGFKNVIAMNGTNIPNTIIDLGKRKTLTVFVDGDRGGDLIIKEILSLAEVDFVTKAPDGKEVEELTKKEIHKALRGKMAAEQAKMEFLGKDDSRNGRSTVRSPARSVERAPERAASRDTRQSRDRDFRSRTQSRSPAPAKKPQLSKTEKESFSSMLENLIGTRGAYILDPKLEILGKVPVSELPGTIKSLKTGIYAIVFDGSVDRELLSIAERSNVNFLVGMDSKVKGSPRVAVVTSEDL
jgi:DNA primase